MTLLALLAVAAVLSVYLFAREARGSDGKPVNKNTYAFLEGRVDVDSPQEAVANSNIATNFQLLSVYPNIIFGMLGNFAVPIINALSYAVGSIILQWRAPHFKALIEHNDNTLHGFIARAHNEPRLKKYTTLVSLGVFAAVVAFEVVFLARILSVLIGGNQIAYYTFVFGFVSFLSVAVYLGGQRTSFFADNFHLFFAYVGIHACLAELLGIVNKDISNDSILLIIGIVTSLMVTFRIIFLFVPTATTRTRTLNILIAASATYLLIRILFTLQADSYPYLQDAQQKWAGSFSASTSTQIAMIFAAICPAIFANFVDFSFWHRLRALTQQSGISEQASSGRQLKVGLFLFIIESPLTWILPLVIGSLAIIAFPITKDILANGQGDPVAAAVQQILNAPGIVTRAVGLLLVIGLVSVAVSTVDSYLASLSYLYAKDMARADRTEHQNVSSGRLFQFLVGIVVVLVFVILDIFIQKTDLLISLFLTIFAPLAALSPVAVWPLLSGRCYNPSPMGRLFLVLSCVGSGLLGLVIGIFAAVNQSTPDLIEYWLPIPVSFVSSWLMYLMFMMVSNQKK